MFNSSDKMKEDRTIDSIESSASLYLNGGDPVFIIDKKGEFIDVNNAFCQKIGRLKEEILGVNIGEASFLTENARKKALYRSVSRLIGKEIPVYALEVIAKSGDVLSLEIDTKPYIIREQVVGEIGIVTNAKKIIRGIEDTELLDAIEEIQKKSDEIRRTQSELEEKSTDRNLLKQELRRITEKWRKSQSEVEEKNNEIRWVQDELERMRHALEFQERELDELRDELRSNQSALEEKNFDVKQVMDELEKKQRDLTEKENKLRMKDEEIRGLRKELKDKLSEIQSKDEELKLRDEDVEKTVAELRDKYLKVKEEELMKLQTELETKQQEMETRDLEMHAKEEDLKQLRKELEARNNIIGEMKTLLIKKRIILPEKTEKNDQLQYHELKMVVEKLLQKDEL